MNAMGSITSSPTQPVNWEYVLKSSSGPFGPYEFGVLSNNTLSLSAIAGGATPSSRRHFGYAEWKLVLYGFC